jgi:hypothetical protein
VDNNNLADLAIGHSQFNIFWLDIFLTIIVLFFLGSYLSGHAVILRRRPSVWVELSVTPSISSIDIASIQSKKYWLF